MSCTRRGRSRKTRMEGGGAGTGQQTLLLRPLVLVMLLFRLVVRCWATWPMMETIEVEVLLSTNPQLNSLDRFRSSVRKRHTMKIREARYATNMGSCAPASASGLPFDTTDMLPEGRSTHARAQHKRGQANRHEQLLLTARPVSVCEKLTVLQSVKATVNSNPKP